MHSLERVDECVGTEAEHSRCFEAMGSCCDSGIDRRSSSATPVVSNTQIFFPFAALRASAQLRCMQSEDSLARDM
jgi:hypothetical protein